MFLVDNEGTTDGGGGGGGLEKPSAAVIDFTVFFGGLAAPLACSSLLQRLRRSRSTQRLIERLSSRLSFAAAQPSEHHCPAAQPSKHAQRFADVSVVNGQATVDEVHYKRLREFPQALVEVSEVGTNADSADFSVSEVATMATSACSRSGHRFRASRSDGLQEREGCCTTDPSRFGGGSYPDFLFLTMEQEGGRRGERGGGGRTFHVVPPTTTAEDTRRSTSRDCSRQGGPAACTDDEREAQPMSCLRAVRQRESPVSRDTDQQATGLSTTSQPLQPRYNPLTSPDMRGGRIITNIGVEDLAAHRAALLHNHVDDDAAANTGAEDKEQRANVKNVTSGSCDTHVDAVYIREKPTTSSTPYEYITQQKAKIAQRTTRSIVDAEPQLSCGSGESGKVASMATLSSASGATAVVGDDATGKGELREVDDGDVTVPTRLPPRKVHREHHRHHLAKGGFIICEDFVPDVAGRRARRRQASAKRQRFVFRLRDEDALYGRSQYLPPRQPVPEEGEE
jgi:hypothetical protein